MGEKDCGLKAWLKINTNSNKKVLRKESGQLQLHPSYLLRVAKQLGLPLPQGCFTLQLGFLKGKRGKGGWFLVKPMENHIYRYMLLCCVFLNRKMMSRSPFKGWTLTTKQIFLCVTDKNLAITWSFKSDILTLREELFAICFEQKLSSCQMWTSRQSLV